jgi:hypothetical protein
MKMTKKAIIAAMFMIIGLSGAVSAKYSLVETRVIPWGNKPGKLPVNMPSMTDDLFGNSDEIQVEVPEHVFIDLKDNVYFGSTADSYIKGFDKTGKEIMFIPSGSQVLKMRRRLSGSLIPGMGRSFAGNPYNDSKPEVDPDKYSYKKLQIGDHYELNSLSNFFVDSLSRVYIEGQYIEFDILPGSDQDYIAIVDFTGKLVEKLNPADFGMQGPLGMMTINSKGVLTFVNFETNEHYTYRDGKLFKGGLDGWLAGNHYYYYRVNFEEFPNGMTMGFELQGDPTFPLYADSIKREICPNMIGTFNRSYKLLAVNCNVLGVSDNLTSFILLDDDEWQIKPDTVMVFSSKFELIDQIVITKHSSRRYSFSPFNGFFIRGDACLFFIYCDDDGMHIEKWQNR